MIYFLKFLASFFLPPGIFFVAFFVMAYFLFKRDEKKIAVSLFVVTSLFYALSTSICSDFLLRSLEKNYSPPNQQILFEKRNEKNVIIVLGGGATKDTPDLFDEHAGNLSSSASARILMGLRLQKILQAPILFSGGQVYADSGSEGLIAKKIFETLDVAPEKIFCETQSVNTTQNAKFSLEFLQKNNLPADNIFLVTSAFHMPRAVLCFENFGAKNIIPCPTDFQTNRIAREFYYTSFRPQSNCLAASSMVLQEYLRMFVTKIFKF